MSNYPGIEVNRGKRGTRYKVRFRDAQGRQRSRTFDRLAEAKDFKATADRERRSGAMPSARADKVTFSEYALTWAKSQRHRESTAKRRDGILSVHLLPALGHLTLDKIRRPVLQQLVEDWESKGLKPNTIRNHVQILRSIFKRAVRDEILGKNPTVDLDLPRVRRPEQRALTPGESVALLDAAGEDYAPIILAFLETGCRWGELASMVVGDFDPIEGTLRVSSSKTDAGQRTIPLGIETTTAISKHLLATGRRGLTEGPLFTSPAGYPLHYANFRRRVLIPAFERAGLEGFTLHSLRRTHATMLVAKGYNAKAVQKRMGHSSIETTLKYYAVATEEDLLSTRTALADYLKGADDARIDQEVGYQRA